MSMMSNIACGSRYSLRLVLSTCGYFHVDPAWAMASRSNVDDNIAESLGRDGHTGESGSGAQMRVSKQWKQFYQSISLSPPTK